MTALLAAVAALAAAAPANAPAGSVSSPSGTVASAPVVVERFEGVARGRDGSVAYVETHEVRVVGGSVASAETRYARPDGRTIARLVSAYAPGSFLPDYEFEDLRTGAREAVRREPGAVQLRDGDRVAKLDLPEDVPLVAGQGLDRYARAHLDALARGETLRVRLALPGRLDAFGFRLRGEPLPDGKVRVRFEPSSIVLRILAPSLEGEYDLSTRRLVRYVGVSNVPAEDGSTQQVEIAYSYSEPTAG
ncbi:MAG TPA: hypothetical protein VFM45_01045 [Anaeromyxobacteraceae bacterium]|nr:hypothetical protein [Anaeromyxobacteraceae bacterium]